MTASATATGTAATTPQTTESGQKVASSTITTPREPTDVSIWTRLERLEPTSLIVVGFVLFVIPEPATSTVGIGMMLLGVAWWVSWWD